MNDPTILLDHIALHVTDLKRSIHFYQQILHMQVYGPVNVGTLSRGGRLLGRVTEGRGLIKGIVGNVSSRALRDQYTDVALLSSSGTGYDILLVQERYPDTNAARSVDGYNIFGFSFFLSPLVEPETLAWDLHQAEADFCWGDPGFDGTVFTKDRPVHSLYIKDPDGRFVELIPNACEKTSSSFIAGLNTITLYTTYPDKSKEFYCEKLGLITEPELTTSVPGKRFIWLKNTDEKRCILLYNLTKPDGNPIEAGGYGLDHFAISGCRVCNNKSIEVTDIRMEPEKLAEHTSSTYIKDSDGYWIECMKQ
ncbi:MAG: hypothetical protein PHD71_07285 [Methanospirillum sp.]|nr:hypothetical protein [Methanospirillum sp.]